LKENIVKLFPILAILQSSSGEDFYKKTTDYDQEKKSTVVWHRDLYLRFGDSNPAKGEGLSACHLQLVPIPSKRVVGAESWRLIDFAVGGTERSSYPLF